MTSALRSFIRESLVHEAVGIDQFGLRSGSSPISVGKEKTFNKIISSIMTVGGGILAGGGSLLRALKTGRTKAFTSVTRPGNWGRAGALGLFAAVVSYFMSGSEEEGEEPTEATADLAEEHFDKFHQALLTVLSEGAGGEFAEALRYDPIIDNSDAANFDKDSKISSFRTYYESKIPGAIEGSDSYDGFFTSFSTLIDSRTTGALKDKVDSLIDKFPKNDKVSNNNIDKLRDALKEWAYYVLIICTTHEFVSNAISSDIGTVLENTKDTNDKDKFATAAKEMCEAYNREITALSAYIKSKKALDDAGYNI